MTVTYGTEIASGLITATKWNTNMTDLVNGLSDGTKNITVANVNASAATLSRVVVGGTATVNNLISSGAIVGIGTATVNNLISSGAVVGTNLSLSGSAVVGTATANSILLSSAIGTNTPTANVLYADLMPKAWAVTTSGGVLSAGVNLTVSRAGAGNYSYTFRRAMANANYTVHVTIVNRNGVIGLSASKTASGFSVFTDFTETAYLGTDSAHDVVVFGTQ